jgi:hypothetical protein
MPLMAMILVTGCIGQQQNNQPNETGTNYTPPPASVETWREIQVYSSSISGTGINELVVINSTKFKLKYYIPSVYPDVAGFNMSVYSPNDLNNAIDSFVATQYNVEGERVINAGPGPFNLRVTATHVDYIIRVEELVS